MRVIKRDGRAVDFKSEKIAIAIEKANTEVKGKDKATKSEIQEIVQYIEDLDKKRILVEDIQDIIEQKLMELKKFNLAKKYIVYRYTRALVRKSNTTDESILGIIKNSNRKAVQNPDEATNIIAPMQRNLIAGEVSKDLTKRILLPEKITTAIDEGVIVFHDAEYFIQPIINSCVINIEDMLDNGTVINGKLIETPKSFETACIIIEQIILAVASSQYGKIYIDVSHLGKYLKNSSNKSIKQGIQTFFYQINTSITANGKPPHVVLLLNLKEDDPYKIENTMIIEEIIRQKEQGLKNEQGELEKIDLPEIITEQKEINKILEHKFDQGKVSINLSQVGKLAHNDLDEFWKALDKSADLCYEALMYRHYALLGTSANISPIHWRYGAISRLAKDETIDNLLKDGSSTLTLGCIGVSEAVNSLIGEEQTQKDEADTERKIIKFLKDKTVKWKKETGITFNFTYEQSLDT